MTTKSLFQRITRRRFDDDNTQNSARELTIPNLIILGIGNSLGIGIYVLSGKVAAEKAGPAVSLSFLIAALSSIFSGLCYAEFSARVPRAGSAYVYSYASIGEFIGFTSGWNLVLSYLLGASSISRGFSGYIDSLANETISSYFRNTMPINVGFLSSYPDIVALSMIMVFTCILATGASESSLLNKVLCVVNSAVVLYFIICGSFMADISNWRILGDGSAAKGTGGYFPFGIQGVLAGAATCFYGFVGFDIISEKGEDVKNSKTAIPISILASLLLVFICYFGISIVLTLMVPYYDQDTHAPLIVAFEKVGWDSAKWIVAGGAVFGLTASLFGSFFPMPRILYAMSCDGLLFPLFSRVSERLQTPFVGTLISGSIAGALATILNLETLVDAMSLGTLGAYSIIAACVVILRYQPSDQYEGRKTSLIPPKSASLKVLLKQVVNDESLKIPTEISGAVASYLTLLICGLLMSVAALLTFGMAHLSERRTYITVILCVLLLLLALCVVFLVRQPFELPEGFKAPLVPYLPILSIFCNFILVLQMKGPPWAIYATWMLVGYAIYFLYGIRHSKEAKRSIVRRRKKLLHNKYTGHRNKAYYHDSQDGLGYTVPVIHVQLATPQSSSHTASVQATVKEEAQEAPLTDYAEFAKSLSESLVKVALENSAEACREEGKEEETKIDDNNIPKQEKLEEDISVPPEPDQAEDGKKQESDIQVDHEVFKEDEKPVRKISKPSALVLVTDHNAQPTPTEVVSNDKDKVFQPNAKTKQPPAAKSSKPRHPKKSVKRTDSGFDIIPPSSPDSPLAQQITEKFVLIPVDPDPMKDFKAESENAEEEVPDADNIEDAPCDPQLETPIELSGIKPVETDQSEVKTPLGEVDEATTPDRKGEITNDPKQQSVPPPPPLPALSRPHGKGEEVNTRLKSDIDVNLKKREPLEKPSPPSKVFGSPEFMAELKIFLGESPKLSPNMKKQQKDGIEHRKRNPEEGTNT